MASTQAKSSSNRSDLAARIFVGICPSQAIRKTLTQYQKAWIWNPHVALVPAIKFHITLCFIGEVERIRLGEIKQALEISFVPFYLNLDTPEVWTGGIAALRPRILPEEFFILHNALTKRIYELGLRVETRATRIHLTLARKARGATCPRHNYETVWPVRAYTLLESRLNSAGPYKVLHKYAHSG
jgi:2'-5' RNA ligase